MTAAYAAAVAGTIGFGLTGLLVFLPNAFKLPMKFYIFFLPIDEISINWALNYAFQLIVEFFAVIFFLGYFCMSMILVNHSCWVLESSRFSIHELGEILMAEELDKDVVRAALKKVLDESLEIISWMNEARRILRMSFLAEITFLSSILCMGIFTFISSPKESIFPLIITTIVFTQLAVYCLMGSRVNRGIEKFQEMCYNLRWDRMKPTQQKDLQLVLVMTQHIKGFDALFKSVDLELFQNVKRTSIVMIIEISNYFFRQVLEVTYTLITLLRTTNKK